MTTLDLQQQHTHHEPGALNRCAAMLYNALARTAGANRFSDQVLTNPNGFSGVDGIFRFRDNGTNDRGLAVYEIGSGNARVVSPAPRSFTAGG